MDFNNLDWKGSLVIGLMAAITLFGVVRNCDQTPPPSNTGPTVLTSFTSYTDIGLFTTDLRISNDTGQDLLEVHVTVKITREDATETKVDRFWTNWKNGEQKTINVTASPALQKLGFNGEAMVHGNNTYKAVRLSANWNIKSN